MLRQYLFLYLNKINKQYSWYQIMAIHLESLQNQESEEFLEWSVSLMEHNLILPWTTGERKR